MDERGDSGAAEPFAAAAGRTFVDGIRLGDATAAAAAYAVGARLIAPSTEVIEGRPGIEAFWQAGIDAGIRDIDREPLAFHGHGSVAFEIGRYTIRLRPAEGGCVVDHGKYLLVHERDDDSAWRWAVEMFSPDGAPEIFPDVPEAPGEEVARN